MKSPKKVFNSDRLSRTRFALRASAYGTIGVMLSFGSCALMVGGLHGMVLVSAIAVALGTVFGSLAVAFGVLSDGAHAAAEAMNLWHPPPPGEVEIGAGQLSVSAQDGEPGLVSMNADAADDQNSDRGH